MEFLSMYFFRDNPKVACQRCCQNIHLKESRKTEEDTDTLVALFLSRRRRIVYAKGLAVGATGSEGMA